MDSSIPLLTPFTSYSEWKMEMIAYLKRQYIYELYIGLGKQSYDNENNCIHDGDVGFGAIVLSLSPSLRYLTKSVEYPKDILTKLDRKFGKNNEDHNNTLESVCARNGF